MKRTLIGLAFLVACLACGWFGFWFGFTEMFFHHVNQQYANDVVELLAARRTLRCLEEGSPDVVATLRKDVDLRRQTLMLAPEPVGWMDRFRSAGDIRPLLPFLQDDREAFERHARMATFVVDESRPATCKSNRKNVEGSHAL